MGRCWFSFWWPVIRHQKMVCGRVRGRWDWILGKGSSLRGSLVAGTGSPGKWSQYQPCQSSRSISTMFLVIWFSFRLWETGRWTWSLWLPSSLEIFCDSLCSSNKSLLIPHPDLEVINQTFSFGLSTVFCVQFPHGFPVGKPKVLSGFVTSYLSKLWEKSLLPLPCLHTAAIFKVLTEMIIPYPE